ncbi:hypothetical protein HN911_11750 [Candidatus Bathyarchaeota archaeon]|nr:hypothetical protein [Candidatus Bathyarchaeota archaeon]
MATKPVKDLQRQRPYRDDGIRKRRATAVAKHRKEADARQKEEKEKVKEEKEEKKLDPPQLELPLGAK